MEDAKLKVIKIIAIGVLIVFNLILSSCKNKTSQVSSEASPEDSSKPVCLNEVEITNIIPNEDWLEQWTRESQMSQIQTVTKSTEIRDELLNSKYPEVAQVAREKMKQLIQAEDEIERIARGKESSLKEKIEASDIPTETEVAEELVKLLYQKETYSDGSLLNRISQSLVKIGKPAVKPLIEALNYSESGEYPDDYSWKTRCQAAKILGDIGLEAKEAVGELIKRLDDDADVAFTQREVVIALGKFGPEAKEAVGRLNKLISDPYEVYWDVRWEAIKALGRIGPDSYPAVPVLTRVIFEKDGAQEIKWSAIETLGNIGPKANAAMPVLKTIMKTGDNYCSSYAARSLALINPTDRTPIKHLIAKMLGNRNEPIFKTHLIELATLGIEVEPELQAVFAERFAKNDSDEGCVLLQTILGDIENKKSEVRKSPQNSEQKITVKETEPKNNSVVIEKVTNMKVIEGNPFEGVEFVPLEKVQPSKTETPETPKDLEGGSFVVPSSPQSILNEPKPKTIQQPKDWFQEAGPVRIPSSGGKTDWIVGFNSFSVPKTVSSGEKVGGNVDMRFCSPGNNDAGAITYISVFGDWKPDTELVRVYHGCFGESPRTVCRKFQFVAPNNPGKYRLRCAIVLAFAPVKNFYGSKPSGQSNPGVGPYTEIAFDVK